MRPQERICENQYSDLNGYDSDNMVHSNFIHTTHIILYYIEHTFLMAMKQVSIHMYSVYFVPEWISVTNESDEWMIHWPTCKHRHWFSSWTNQCVWTKQSNDWFNVVSMKPKKKSNWKNPALQKQTEWYKQWKRSWCFCTEYALLESIHTSNQHLNNPQNKLFF